MRRLLVLVLLLDFFRFLLFGIDLYPEGGLSLWGKHAPHPSPWFTLLSLLPYMSYQSSYLIHVPCFSFWFMDAHHFSWLYLHSIRWMHTWFLEVVLLLTSIYGTIYSWSMILVFDSLIHACHLIATYPDAPFITSWFCTLCSTVYVDSRTWIGCTCMSLVGSIKGIWDTILDYLPG
jgi:hypothetical protein